jgi:hypothetical protein
MLANTPTVHRHGKRIIHKVDAREEMALPRHYIMRYRGEVML